MLGATVVVAVALLGALAANFTGTTLLGFARSPISAVTFAILGGIALAHWLPGLAGRIDAATRFGTGPVLRFGIVLLGLKLSLASASALGIAALPVVLACILAALLLVTLAGRAMGLSRELTALIAVGTSICGVTAIAATAPLIRAREVEISYATACITLFGMLALLAYPFVAHALFAGTPVIAGIFLGTSIHDTAQVAGAALAYADVHAAPEALEAATVTKLLRNLFMAAVIPLAAIALNRPAAGGEARGSRPPLVPLFVVGFVLACGVRSFGDATAAKPFGLLDPQTWQAVLSAAAHLSEAALLVAMAAIGLRTRLSAFRHLGWRPVALASCAAAVVGVVSIVTLHLLG